MTVAILHVLLSTVLSWYFALKVLRLVLFFSCFFVRRRNNNNTSRETIKLGQEPTKER